jgi:rubredoxin
MANQTIVKTADGLEAVVEEWTCPNCKHVQSDTVHPELGPFFSCTCGNCGHVFENHQLSEADRETWERARAQAESVTQAA